MTVNQNGDDTGGITLTLEQSFVGQAVLIGGDWFWHNQYGGIGNFTISWGDGTPDASWAFDHLNEPDVTMSVFDVASAAMTYNPATHNYDGPTDRSAELTHNYASLAETHVVTVTVQPNVSSAPGVETFTVTPGSVAIGNHALAYSSAVAVGGHAVAYNRSVALGAGAVVQDAGWGKVAADCWEIEPVTTTTTPTTLIVGDSAGIRWAIGVTPAGVLSITRAPEPGQ
jgi:hypothetical protein